MDPVRHEKKELQFCGSSRVRVEPSLRTKRKRESRVTGAAALSKEDDPVVVTGYGAEALLLGRSTQTHPLGSSPTRGRWLPRQVLRAMPLQNRVTPFGEIVAAYGRGLMMGNRGVLHDDERHIIRYSQLRRWLICVLEFRGRHREIMRPHSYTELFFLDEATALAAGHRPCAECRHADYLRFRNLWAISHGESANADAIDRGLERDRLAGPRTKRTYWENLRNLPDGAYITLDGRAWLIWDSKLFGWSAEAYGKSRPRQVRGEVEVLTPRSTVAVLAAGYRAAVHPSAG